MGNNNFPECCKPKLEKNKNILNINKTSNSNLIESKQKNKSLNINLFQKSINENFIEIRKSLFNIINDMREYPYKYIDLSREYNLYDYFKFLNSGNKLIFSIKKYKEIKNYFNDLNINNKTEFEKEKDIKQILKIGKLSEILICQTISSYQNINENIWSLLSNNEDNIINIINTHYDKLFILCEPISSSEEILTIFIFYENKNL